MGVDRIKALFKSSTILKIFEIYDNSKNEKNGNRKSIKSTS